jgi:hypothetical protein
MHETVWMQIVPEGGSWVCERARENSKVTKKRYFINELYLNKTD